MIGKVLKPVLRRFGYDLTPYPVASWELWEPTLRTSVSEILKTRQINCVIDVGANHGQYGTFLRQIGYKGRIVSFEPVSNSFAILSELTKQDPSWMIHNLAMGSQNEVLQINVMDGDVFSSLLSVNTYGRDQYPKQATLSHTESVNVVRLDSMMDEITAGLDEPRVYLKMDTQGYDLKVIEGATGCLSLVKGLQSEIALRSTYEGMPDYLTSLAKLNAMGFSVSSLVAVSRDESLRIIEFDCLMVRSS